MSREGMGSRRNHSALSPLEMLAQPAQTQALFSVSSLSSPELIPRLSLPIAQHPQQRPWLHPEPSHNLDNLYLSEAWWS